MSHKTLPYLTCLNATINSLAATSTQPGAAVQGALTSRLIHHMAVQRTVLPTLRADCYRALQKLLPDIEQLVGSQQPAPGNITSAPEVEKLAHPKGAKGALGELKSICGALDTNAFDRFLQLTGDLQRVLFANNSPQARTLCKAIVKIEGDFSHSFEAAVDAAVAAADNQQATVMRNVRAYDEKALLAFIRQCYPEERDLGLVQSDWVAGGTSKFTLGITLSGARSIPENLILRGDAAGTFCGASVADEYRLIKVLHENGVAVPRPIGLEESGSVFGSSFLLVEKLPGGIIGHMYALPKAKNKAICDDIAAKLAAIHKVPVAAFGDGMNGARLRSSDKARAWIEEGYDNWLPLNLPSPAFEVAFEWLRQHADVNDRAPRALVHGDYGLNNLLIHEDGVSAILDWEFAHIGNPAYDLAYFHFMAQSLSSWEEFLDAYARAGAPIPSQEQLDYNMVFAATRLGVMAGQVSAAFTSGAEPVLAGAAVVGGNYWDMTIDRVAGTLAKVL